VDSGAWIGIKIAALYLQTRSDNANLVPSLLSLLIMKSLAFVVENPFEPAVSRDGTEIWGFRDSGIGELKIKTLPLIPESLNSQSLNSGLSGWMLDHKFDCTGSVHNEGDIDEG